MFRTINVGSLLYAGFYKENSHSFISSSFVTIFIGILCILANLEKDLKLNFRQTFLFSTFAWVTVAIFGSLPFLLSSQTFTFSDAFLESMSGITTTGATIISDLDNSPKKHSVVAGYHAVVGRNRYCRNGNYNFATTKSRWNAAFKMEGPDSTEKILPRTVEVAAIIVSTYIVLTLLCGFFYWIFGMTVFDSVCHSMTTIATGGFSTHNDSIGFLKIQI